VQASSLVDIVAAMRRNRKLQIKKDEKIEQNPVKPLEKTKESQREDLIKGRGNFGKLFVYRD
jgi:hypothetical protein